MSHSPCYFLSSHQALSSPFLLSIIANPFCSTIVNSFQYWFFKFFTEELHPTLQYSTLRYSIFTFPTVLMISSLFTLHSLVFFFDQQQTFFRLLCYHDFLHTRWLQLLVDSYELSVLCWTSDHEQLLHLWFETKRHKTVDCIKTQMQKVEHSS